MKRLSLPESTVYNGKQAVIVGYCDDRVLNGDIEEHDYITEMLYKYCAMAIGDGSVISLDDVEVEPVPFYDATNLFYLLNDALKGQIPTHYSQFITAETNIKLYGSMHSQCEDIAKVTSNGETLFYIHYVHGDCGMTSFYLL